MDVIGKCRVTRAWEKFIQIRNDDSFTPLRFCYGTYYVDVQVNQFPINSIDASVSFSNATS
jgi:hypothetical protein